VQNSKLKVIKSLLLVAVLSFELWVLNLNHMHSCDLDVSINKLSKIEGHADLDIKIRNGEVFDVNLRVAENRRFYTKAVEGKLALSVPQLVSRICGTCSVAHLTASIEAVEKTLDIKPSKQTSVMRKLMMYSLMIRDHALHLYFFALPDIFGIDSILDLPKDKSELIHQALHIKEAGNNLSNLIGGRAVHAPFEQVGGFIKEVDKTKIKPIIKELKSIRNSVKKLADVFYQCKWELIRETNFVALVTPDFSFLEGKICSTSGACIEEENYWDHLQNRVLPYSQAQGFEFEGDEYMVGSLARLNLNKNNLHINTQKTMKKYIDIFPSYNIYHNNLAQAIEIMHSIDHSIEILENTEFKKEETVKPEKQTGEGVGVIEAPRGTLYYWLSIKAGKVKYANLVIPTAQNILNIREDLRQLVSVICHSKNPRNQWEGLIKKQAERIIRAYDPCMSCASHFLKVNWL
jgi:sulfhydrogenase subunit alpha